jgi:KipI family sensor histidine kinase inhibitor
VIPPSVRDAGDAALVIELGAGIDAGVNARAVAVAAAIVRAQCPGVYDVIPTFRSVAVYFDPLHTDAATLRRAIDGAAGTEGPAPRGRTIEVPVVYGGADGPDLDGLARSCGMSRDDVVARHAAVEYRVFMLGFLPGFAYMAPVDPAIAAARHATPRTRVAAGSVGIAGIQTGIYPLESPGGWQIIGRTNVEAFDARRIPPALFAPGDRVRFVPVTTLPPVEPRAPRPLQTRSGRHVTVRRPGFFTTVQDAGRRGYQHVGVPVSGAMDRPALARANRLVGNDPGAAALEVTVDGPEIEVESQTMIAVSGGEADVTVDGSAAPGDVAISCGPGTRVRIGRVRGGRACVAFDGGIDVPLVLGSRSTLVRARLGGLEGRALRAGDRLPLGQIAMQRPANRDAIPWGPASAGPGPGSPRTAVAGGVIAATDGGGVRLRVLPGPQRRLFDDHTLATFERSRFVVTPQSDRMGYRLDGPMLRGAREGEMISDATFAGSLQVPPSGSPILLMADRQTTGGYPQIAIVITADLPAAGRLMPGDWVEFEPCSREAALLLLRQSDGGRSAPGGR